MFHQAELFAKLRATGEGNVQVQFAQRSEYRRVFVLDDTVQAFLLPSASKGNVAATIKKGPSSVFLADLEKIDAPPQTYYHPDLYENADPRHFVYNSQTCAQMNSACTTSCRDEGTFTPVSPFGEWQLKFEPQRDDESVADVFGAADRLRIDAAGAFVVCRD